MGSKGSGKGIIIVLLVIACVAVYFAITQGNAAKHKDDELKTAVTSMVKETEALQAQVKSLTDERDALARQIEEERAAQAAALIRVREETIGQLPGELRAQYETLSNKIASFGTILDEFNANLTARLNEVTDSVANSGIIENITNFDAMAAKAAEEANAAKAAEEEQPAEEEAPAAEQPAEEPAAEQPAAEEQPAA